MKSIIVYAVQLFAEIAGCFAFWAWLRLGASGWWLLPGIVSLGLQTRSKSAKVIRMKTISSRSVTSRSALFDCV